MLFEEWTKGTGCANESEYKLAEKLYSAMPENFQKKDLYEMRMAMNEDHFIALCKLVEGNYDSLANVQRQYEKLKVKVDFINGMLEILKADCKMDVIQVYAAHMAEKAEKAERQRIIEIWESLK